MDKYDVLSFGPAFLVPAAWLLTLANVTGRLGTSPIYIMHVVMLAFLASFVYLGWERMDEGVMKAWRTVILLGIPFTAAGLAGFVMQIPDLYSFVPDILYWASIPSIASIYTGFRSEKINVNLLAGGSVSVLGLVLSTFWIFDLFYFSWPGFALLAAGQLVTLIEALRLDKS